MRVTLRVIAGPQTGRLFTFDQHETFMIGRSEDSQFCLPHDRYFSRHHCLLEIAPYEAKDRPWAPQRNTAYWSPKALIMPESSPVHIKFSYIRFALYNQSNTLLRDCTVYNGFYMG